MSRASDKPTTTTSIRIRGMSCGHCVKAVAAALADVEGLRVQSVDIGHAVVVCSDPSVLGKAVAAVAEAGCEAAVDAAPR
jgi:copper chaperone